ncbi:MAG: hypothetical protein ACRD0A_08535 [Acidimicrobiales bacterium]
MAALQDPRKEVLGYRNLFPTKIALRLDERTQVDMVLGEAPGTPGLAVTASPTARRGWDTSRSTGSGSPNGRAAHVTDADIAELAARFAAPVPSEAEEPAT